MKTLFLDLLKALINATLLLLALCLYLGWQLMARIDGITGQVTHAVAQVTPIQDRVEALRLEVAALRSEITTRPELAVKTQLAALDRRLASLQQDLASLRQLPAEIIRDAAQTGAAELAGQIARLSSCQAPPS